MDVLYLNTDMNGKRIWIILGVVVFLAVAAYVLFQVAFAPSENPEVYRIGILSGLEYFSEVTEGFMDGMSELGYINGKNVAYDVQKTDFDIPKYQEMLSRFVSSKVDLVLVFPTEASQEAKQSMEGTGIPVLFAVANIEDTGLVDNVARPGGNITGVRYPGPDIALQRFEIFQDLVPDLKRVWIFYQRGYPIVRSQMNALYPVAESSGVVLEELPADNVFEVVEILNSKVVSRDTDPDAILILAEPLMVTPETFTAVAEFAEEYGIPFGGAMASFGGYTSLFGVNIRPYEAGVQATDLANKILQGAEAGNLPVVSAESFFSLNYDAVQRLGLEVDESILNRATKIIRSDVEN